MFARSSNRNRDLEAPVELRFIDLFLIIVATLVFVTILLSLVTAFVQPGKSGMSPQIKTQVLPSAMVGVPYELALSVVGGTPPYSWDTQSELPPGIELDAREGRLHGIAQELGSWQTALGVDDQEGNRARGQYVFNVVPAPSGGNDTKEHRQLWIEAPSIQLRATQNEKFEHRLEANGGVPPYSWRLAEGSLAEYALSLTSSGEILGEPVKAGVLGDLRLIATDAVGDNVEKALRIDIVPGKPTLWQKVFPWLFLAMAGLGFYQMVGWTARVVSGWWNRRAY
jgi:hypothetical protein